MPWTAHMSEKAVIWDKSALEIQMETWWIKVVNERIRWEEEICGVAENSYREENPPVDWESLRGCSSRAEYTQVIKRQSAV